MIRTFIFSKIQFTVEIQLLDRLNQKGRAGRCRTGAKMEAGSIVHIDYDLFNASNEKLIETTKEDSAKEHEIHDEIRIIPQVLSGL